MAIARLRHTGGIGRGGPEEEAPDTETERTNRCDTLRLVNRIAKKQTWSKDDRDTVLAALGIDPALRDP